MSELEKWEETPTESRQYRAHKLRLAGHDWATVAEACDYNSPQHAAMDVKRWMDHARIEQSKEERSDAIAQELARVDALQAAWWDAAVNARDDKAAQVVLKCIAQRSKLKGLEETRTAETGPRTIIITRDSMSDQLKRVVEETENKEITSGTDD